MFYTSPIFFPIYLQYSSYMYKAYIYMQPMVNSVDPDQLASKKQADLYLHCFQNSIYFFGMVRVKV